MHIKRQLACKRPAERGKTLCNIHKTRILSNVLSICIKFFTCDMQKCVDLLGQEDNVYYFIKFGEQLACAHQVLQMISTEMEPLCNIHKTKSLSNILFICSKIFTCEMQKCDDLLGHINQVKALPG